ncbi:apoptosis-associated speck-like protein containing a CARD [Pantherophis guttatus]|uniref:Apoptosis-associated speck-like protein containing a CARD n=1 Tax=Pantherophis guttatus TaxID=94885 RepID=A0A6P9BVY4_PANGU|nr:apoptosis-associated speck-like protein containing a CARD [Pantherophis guttatus]
MATSAWQKSVRFCLAEALENLTEEELKKFKANLNEFPVKEDFRNIPRGTLQKAGALELSDLLVNYYCEDYAVEVAARVLSDSNCRPQAQKLRRDTGKDACSSVQEPVPQISTPSTQPEVQAPGMHFIERHRWALIQRTTTVEEILDQLYEVILTHEQYESIMVQKTSQDKMRELYSLVPGWDQRCKDFLYKVLKEKRRPLIEDLERQTP